jgi:hypothetical protein
VASCCECGEEPSWLHGVSWLVKKQLKFPCKYTSLCTFSSTSNRTSLSPCYFVDCCTVLLQSHVAVIIKVLLNTCRHVTSVNMHFTFIICMYVCLHCRGGGEVRGWENMASQSRRRCLTVHKALTEVTAT